MEIFAAMNQWATRPADERFWTIQGMVAACLAYRKSSVTSTVRYKDLRVEAVGQDLRLVGLQDSAALTHYAFGQLAQRVKAPASYLRTLPATLAAQNINHGFKGRDATDEAKLLFHRNGGLVLRAALSEKYERIWNHEVGEKLLEMEADGWRVPPARPAPVDDLLARPATEADVLTRRGGGGLSVNVGDMIAPAGVYASDRDMFVFLVNEDRAVDDGTDSGLARFLMLWNSEVGDKSLGGIGGYYKHVCGNHIVWDAQGVVDFRIRHVGRRARHKAWRQLKMDVRKYADSSANETEARIKLARTFELGAGKESTIDAVLGFARKRKLTSLNADRIGAAYDAAERHEGWYGCPPTSVYGIVNGLTEVSQQTRHAETRAKLDRAAGKVMEIAF